MACLDLGLPPPQDHLQEESRDIIGPVDSTRRGALVREVPLTEKPVENATDSASVRGDIGRRSIISPVNSARRGALIREVPPIEAPIESAAKERQCVRRYRSKERREIWYRQRT